MASDYELTIDVDASPDVTWSVVGDPVGVPRWFPKYVECVKEGDLRTLTSAEGGVLVERIIAWDDAERSYRYTVVQGPPLASHEAGFRVLARGADKSTVIWDTHAVFLDATIDAETRLAPAQREGLERLKALCEERAAAG